MLHFMIIPTKGPVDFDTSQVGSGKSQDKKWVLEMKNVTSSREYLVGFVVQLCDTTFCEI